MITHITYQPTTASRTRWETTGTILEEAAPPIWIQKDRFGLLGGAGHDVAGWYNLKEDIPYELVTPIEAIADVSKKGYPKLTSTRDTVTGRWVSIGRIEDVQVGDVIVMKGEGFPRETVASIEVHGNKGFRKVTFASGGSFDYPPRAEIYHISM